MLAQREREGTRGGAVLALLCVAQFVDVLGVTVVVVALPSIAGDLGAGREAMQWVISLYALCFGGFLLLAGRAADLFGRRRMLVAGLAALAIASLACGLAPSVPALLAARAAQGLAAAIVVPAALALLTARFPPGPQRVRALGAWTAAGAAGGAAGFLVGGLITAAVGWRWVFLANVPVALGAAALAPRLLTESRGVGTPRLDLAGAWLVTAGLGATIAGLTLAAERGPAAPEAIAGLVGGTALLAAFSRVETRHAAPLLAPAVLRRPGLTAAAAAGFALTATTSSAAVLLTSHLQDVLHRSPTATGLVFLPFSLFVVAGSLLGSRILARAGARRTVASGLAVLAGGVLLYRAADAGLEPVLAGLAVTGLALGWASVAATSIGMSAVPRSEQGLAAGLLNAAAQIGTAAGVAIVSGLAAARTAALAGGGPPSRAELAAGLHAGWLAAAAFAGTAALLAATARR